MDRPSGTVTFLFTDIEGSTAAWDGHHSAMSIAQARHDEIVRSAVGRECGYIFSTGGDGIAAAFQSARAAVTAAAAMQRAFGSEAWPDPLQIRVRMGMHTGEAIERDGDYFGPSVIKAARLMSLVEGGRVACSSATAELVQIHLADDLELLPVGTVHLKGLSRSEPVFVVAGPGLLEQGTPLAAARAPMRAVPIASSRLIGRASELGEVVEALDHPPLVTLTGMGGIGKTRLAQAAVESVTDRFAGVAWADLASAQDRTAAVYEIAMAIDVRPQPGEDVFVTVLHALAARELLLVLDNCEHLRADVADLVLQIGARVAGATVLATSRERLGGSAERVIALGPLDTADASAALALLVDRLDGSDSVDQREALDSIVRQVEGIPLAIELAAARCRSLGVSEVAIRLRGELRSLADQKRPIERHRTLEQVIAWSYNTLSSEERVVLRRLSVFAGAFTLESAELTAGGDLSTGDVDDALVALVDRSLVARQRHRFRILEPTRQFAHAQFESVPELERIRDQHVNAMLKRIAAVHDGLNSGAEAHWVEELEADWADIRLAVHRALDADAADAAIFLVIHLASEAFRRRPEAFSWIDETVRRFGDRPGAHRHELLGAGSWVAWTTLDIERGLALGEAAVSIERSPGAALDGLPQAGLIGALNFSGQPQQAAAVARTALDRNGPLMSPATRVMLLGSEAISLALAGDSAASSVGDEAVAQGERAGIPSALGLALYSAALARQLSGGDPVESALALDRARTLAESVANHWLLGMCGGLDVAATGSNDATLQLTAALDAMDDLMQNGWSTHAWTAGWAVPGAFAALGHLEAAATWLGACLACGVPQLASTVLPAELESALAGEGDPQWWNAVATGRELTFVELRRLTDTFVGAVTRSGHVDVIPEQGPEAQGGSTRRSS